MAGLSASTVARAVAVVALAAFPLLPVPDFWVTLGGYIGLYKPDTFWISQ